MTYKKNIYTQKELAVQGCVNGYDAHVLATGNASPNATDYVTSS